MKGKLPATHFIILESHESQWRMLTRGLIEKLETTATINISEIKKVRVKLVIFRIIPPEESNITNICKAEGNLGEQVTNGIARSHEFINNYLDKSVWRFIGHINGEDKSPILITYYESLKLSVYTQKLTTETIQNFFDPQLN